jgi:hypothetical protein
MSDGLATIGDAMICHLSDAPLNCLYRRPVDTYRLSVIVKEKYYKSKIGRQFWQQLDFFNCYTIQKLCWYIYSNYDIT